MRIAICDDDASWNRYASKVLTEYLSERGEEAEILCFEDGEELFSYEGPPISLVFMDIEFDQEHDENVFKGEGIAFAARINRLWEDCLVVYCTNYLSYALDVYETDHIYYIVKSQFGKRLDPLFDKMRKMKEYRGSELFIHVINSGIACFPIKDIRYFERKARYTNLCSEEGVFRVRERIPEIMDMLPPESFTRCHTSFLLNMEYILKKNGNNYLLKTGQQIPISRTYIKTTREEFLEWCSDQIR